jgi:hypothetical protein
MSKKAKKGKKKSAAYGDKRLFSLVALHREFKNAQDRIKKQPPTAAATKLAQDLKNARAMVDCGQTMQPNIA